MTRPPRQRRVAGPALLLAVLLCVALDAAAALRASLDRSQVYEGDTLTLTIEAEGTGGGEPDLSPLARDFDLLGTSQGSRITIINGRRSDTRTWQVTLAPKRLGEIAIPPIPVGGEQTRALTLTVAKVPEGGDGGPGDDVFVELDLGIDADTVLVQQQVPLVVRLYSALPLRGGDLTEPRADGVVLERLGADTQYRAERNGREYQVIERRFSLSPERSGELRIAPVQFEGELAAQRRRPASAFSRMDRLFDDPVIERMLGDSPFSMLERGEPVRARSGALTIQVEPRPDGFSGDHWLPAQALAIDDAWADDPPALEVGEPVTRTLTITAQGLAGTQIPELAMEAPPGLQVYPEQTETESRTDGTGLYGVSTQQVTLIPTAPGTLRLPEIRLPWWDTVARVERVARVPALTLEVAAGAGAPGATGAAPEPGSQAGARSVPEPAGGQAATGDAEAPGAEPPASDPIHWSIRLGAAALLLALGALGLVLLRRRFAASRPRPAPASAPGRDQDRGARESSAGHAAAAQRAALRAACAGNDPAGAARALLNWAGAVWPVAPVNLARLADHLAAGDERQARAAAQVRVLEQRLYAPGAGPWDGDELWAAVRDGLGSPVPAGDEARDGLAPLYPRRV